MRRSRLVLAFALLLSLTGASLAHELVAKPAKMSTGKGPLPIEIHSGHIFIVAEEVEDIPRIKAGLFKGGKLNESKLHANEKKQCIDTEVVIDNPAVSSIFLVNKDGGVWSTTNEGGKSGTRQELEKKGLKVTKAVKYDKYVKVIINASKNDKNFATVTGQPLEIIPITNPADAKVDQFFDVKVLLNGKPYSGNILATYDGFVTKHEDTYAYSTICSNGVAHIKITAPGLWGVRAMKDNLPGKGKEYDSITAKSFLIFNVK